MSRNASLVAVALGLVVCSVAHAGGSYPDRAQLRRMMASDARIGRHFVELTDVPPFSSVDLVTEKGSGATPPLKYSADPLVFRVSPGRYRVTVEGPGLLPMPPQWVVYPGPDHVQVQTRPDPARRGVVESVDADAVFVVRTEDGQRVGLHPAALAKPAPRYRAALQRQLAGYVGRDVVFTYPAAAQRSCRPCEADLWDSRGLVAAAPVAAGVVDFTWQASTSLLERETLGDAREAARAAHRGIWASYREPKAHDDGAFGFEWVFPGLLAPLLVLLIARGAIAGTRHSATARSALIGAALTGGGLSMTLGLMVALMALPGTVHWTNLERCIAIVDVLAAFALAGSIPGWLIGAAVGSAKQALTRR